MVNLTHSTKPVKEKDIKRQWHLIDVGGKILGRVSPQVAKFLQGKHKREYSPHLDGGDYVVAVNVKDVKLTGKKSKLKAYTRYSGYPGGLKTTKFEDLIKKNPVYVFRHAVSGMLPKNKLKDRRLTRLFIFKDENHPYKDKFEARNPKSKTN